jgi:methylated-DNA-[protein]-cysteine S-methyltransferase
MKKDKKPNPIYIGQTKDTPLGNVWIGTSETGLWVLDFRVSREAFLELVQRRANVAIIDNPGITAPILREVVEYLQGECQHFSTPVDWTGMTPFQIEVRKAVMSIPYGQTATYAEIAAQIGRPAAARAVGRANATNPIPLVIPCHRLVGADGGLRGYGGAGGIKTKQWLLDLERANSTQTHVP